jgi:hypothetical protein
MLTDLKQAPDVHRTLQVVGRGLADSGFAAATLSVPVWFDIPSGEEDGWHASHGASPRALIRSLQWEGEPAGAPALTIVALPLFEDERPGSLSISTQADEWHQASLINWLGREVAQTVGVHLARTADQSAFSVGARAFGEARSSRSGTQSLVVPPGRAAVQQSIMARFGNWGRR